MPLRLAIEAGDKRHADLRSEAEAAGDHAQFVAPVPHRSCRALAFVKLLGGDRLHPDFAGFIAQLGETRLLRQRKQLALRAGDFLFGPDDLVGLTERARRTPRHHASRDTAPAASWCRADP